MQQQYWRKSDLPDPTSQYRILLNNALIWTGEEEDQDTDVQEENCGKSFLSARKPFVGYIIIHGNIISNIGVSPYDDNNGNVDEFNEIIDCSGYSIIPGLIEGHAHPSFESIVMATDTGDVPAEEGILQTVRNLRRILDAGFTSAFSAAATRIRLDVVARNWINAGQAPGPRLLAASPEICSTGCLGDFSALHQHRDSFGLVADGEDELRKTIRLCIREGVDTIKINIGGDLIPTNMLTPNEDDIMTTYTDREVFAAVDEAHRRGVRVAAHCRGSNDVRLALKHGVDVIYHADFAHRHESIIQEIVEAKDRVIFGPAVGLMDALSPNGYYGPQSTDEGAIPPVDILLQNQKKTYNIFRKKGIPVVVGGDYGFATTPQGLQANDLNLFVKHFHYTDEEALVCATRIGGHLMQMKVGQIKEGWLADMLIVKGCKEGNSPWEDVTTLKASISADGNIEAPNITAIIQNGQFHKRNI